MKRDKYINVFKKEDGAGLVLALMVLMVLAVLGVAVSGVTIGSHKLGNISRDNNSAFYIAEAGANLAYEEIKVTVWEEYNPSDKTGDFYFETIRGLMASFSKTYENFSVQFGDKPIATVTIEKENPTDNNDHKYILVSEGEIGGNKRTVRKPFEISWKQTTTGGGGTMPALPENCVLLSAGNISFKNNAEVYGDIMAPGKKVNNISGIKHKTVAGKSPGIVKDSNDISLDPFFALKFPVVPTNPTYSYKKYSPTVIDTKNRTIDIVAEDVTINNNLTINGSGTVNLYITKSLTMNNKVEINTGPGSNVEQLNIIYAGNALVINNLVNIKGSLIVKKKLDVGNNGNITGGFIIAFGDITVENKGEVNANIYAPFSKVTFNNNATLNGTIMAKEMELNKSNINYDISSYLKDYPFAPEGGETSVPGSGGGDSYTPTLDDLISADPALEVVPGT